MARQRELALARRKQREAAMAKPAGAAAAVAPRPGRPPLAPMAAAAQLSDAQRSAIARKREEAMARLALKRKRKHELGAR
jgi:hypothetical protein